MQIIDTVCNKTNEIKNLLDLLEWRLVDTICNKTHDLKHDIILQLLDTE